MFKLLIFCLLVGAPAATTALTKEDLPKDMQECIDNVIIPVKQFIDANDEKCRSIGATEYEEYSKCSKPADDRFYSQENIDCMVIQHDLPKVQSVFVNLHIRKVLYDDDYSKLPENFRECMDHVQPELRKYFELIQECEPLFNLRDPKQSEEFRKCQKNNGKKLEAYQPTPELKKCMESSNLVPGYQRKLVEPYMFKIAYNL